MVLHYSPAVKHFNKKILDVFYPSYYSITSQKSEVGLIILYIIRIKIYLYANSRIKMVFHILFYGF